MASAEHSIGGSTDDIQAAWEQGPAGQLEFPDWCDPSPWLWTYVCEQYVGSPIWCTVFVADGIALWMIAAILLRQRAQNQEVRRARLEVSRAVRGRHNWNSLACMIRLATLAARGGKFACWRDAWEKVAASRRDRRQYLLRVDFNLPAVMQRAAGPLLVLGVLLLITFEVHAFYTIGAPWWFRGPLRHRGWYASMAVTATCFLRIYVDYARTMLTDPGRPEADAAADKLGGRAGGMADVELGGGMGQEMPQCRHCRMAKPRRCHHCKVCRRCVLKMDHHCPFVNNCVGLRNYRYFCWFLVDLIVGCLLVLLSILPQVPDMLRGGGVPKPTVAHRVHVLAAGAVALLASGLLLPFFTFHFQLILMNETTLEHFGRRYQPRRGTVAAAAGGGRAAGAEGGHSQGVVENFGEVCGAPPAVCHALAERILRRLVPFHIVRMAKRSE